MELERQIHAKGCNEDHLARKLITAAQVALLALNFDPGTDTLIRLLEQINCYKQIPIFLLSVNHI